MNCEPLLHKCRSECCGPCPIREEVYHRNRNRVAHEPAQEFVDGGRYVHAIDSTGMCVFRGDDFRCAIYDQRPRVCREFGRGHHPLLLCPWQTPDGRERSKGSRKRLRRRMAPITDEVLKRLAGAG